MKSLCTSRTPVRRGREATSYRQHFLADKVQPDDARRLLVIKVAAHRVAYLLTQRRKIVGLREDRLTQGSRGEATLRCFLNQENDLVHDHP